MLGFQCVLVLLIVLGTATAKYKKYTVGIDDGENKFNEKVYIDTEKNIDIIKVPAHGNSDAAIILNDANRGIRITKVPRLKTCFLERKVQPVSPKQLKASLIKTRYHPVTKYSFIQRGLYIKGSVKNRDDLGAAAKSLCNGYEMKEVGERKTLSGKENDATLGKRSCYILRVCYYYGGYKICSYYWYCT